VLRNRRIPTKQSPNGISPLSEIRFALFTADTGRDLLIETPPGWAR
jgi:hypothetical protein